MKKESMKKKSLLICIALMGFVLVACIATSVTTQEIPTATVLPPTNTAFVPNAAPPTATAVIVVPTTNAAATAMPVLPAQPVVSGSPVALYQIQMLDPSNGWGWTSDADNTSRILRTQDGAATWVDVSPNGQPLRPTDSFFLDPQTAWVSLFDPTSNSNTLLRTNDGGKTWTTLPQPETTQNARYHFSSANDGIAEAAGVGAGNIYFNFYQTHDGGATWAVIPLVAPKPESGLPDGTVHLCNICGDSLYYDSTRTVITYGDLANDPAGVVHLAVSTDLGQHWNDLKLPLPDPKYASGMQSPRPPVFFGNDGLLPETIMQYGDNNSIAYKVLAIYVTHDGGQSWSLAPGVLVNDKLIFESVQILSMQDIFVRCGKSLCATHDGAQTWQTLPESLNFDSTVGGPDYVSQFQFLNPTTGWAVTGEGAATTLWQTVDGGVTWAKSSPVLQK
jgi:photosystem II stability/assembly factor-like uncharacterized protein